MVQYFVEKITESVLGSVFGFRQAALSEVHGLSQGPVEMLTIRARKIFLHGWLPDGSLGRVIDPIQVTPGR